MSYLGTRYLYTPPKQVFKTRDVLNYGSYYYIIFFHNIKCKYLTTQKLKFPGCFLAPRHAPPVEDPAERAGRKIVFSYSTRYTRTIDGRRYANKINNRLRNYLEFAKHSLFVTKPYED